MVTTSNFFSVESFQYPYHLTGANMKRRLYYLLPDHSTARNIVNELLLARIPFKQMHIMAKDDSEMSDLPAASMLQTSDIVRAMELGLVIGGITGTCAGIAFSLISVTLFSTGGLILICALAGAIIGSWAAGMIGINVPSTRLKSFTSKIDNGELLMMVDISKDKINEVSELVTSHINVKSEGFEPKIPAFP